MQNTQTKFDLRTYLAAVQETAIVVVVISYLYTDG